MFVQFGTYYYSCEDKTKFNHLIRVAVHGSGSINELLLNDNLLTELVSGSILITYQTGAIMLDFNQISTIASDAFYVLGEPGT